MKAFLHAIRHLLPVGFSATSAADAEPAPPVAPLSASPASTPMPVPSNVVFVPGLVYGQAGGVDLHAEMTWPFLRDDR